MKLNKDICKKCRKQLNFFVWTEHDEASWYLNGFSMCPRSDNPERVAHVDKVPDNCLYHLEHMLVKRGILAVLMDKMCVRLKLFTRVAKANFLEAIDGIADGLDPDRW